MSRWGLTPGSAEWKAEVQAALDGLRAPFLPVLVWLYAKLKRIAGDS